jgi:hypothetical protein
MGCDKSCLVCSYYFRKQPQPASAAHKRCLVRLTIFSCQHDNTPPDYQQSCDQGRCTNKAVKH